MAIPFNPPEWLLQEYMKRKTPGEEALAGAKDAAALYLQKKQQDQTQQLAQQSKDVEMAKGIADSGQDFTKALEQIKAQRVVPKTSSPIIDFFKSKFSPAAPTATPAPGAPPVSTGTVSGMTPAPTGTEFMTPIPSLPPQPQPAPPRSIDEGFVTPTGELDQAKIAEYKTQHGRKGLENLDKQLSLSDKLQTAHDRRQPHSVYDKKGNKQFEVEPNARIVEPNSNLGETRAERLGSSLRTELTRSKPYERFTTSKAAAENIENAVKNPGAYGDLGLLFDSMKTLDPTSVIMIGEQQLFQATGSLPQRIANSLNKMVKGETLQPAQRQEILRYSKSRLKTAHGIYKSHSDPTMKHAKRLGVDPLEVDPYYGQTFDDDEKASGAISSKAEYDALPSGATYIWNGETRRKK